MASVRQLEEDHYEGGPPTKKRNSTKSEESKVGSGTKRTYLKNEEWEPHKEFILQLRRDKVKELDILEALKEERGFNVELHQLKKVLQGWQSRRNLKKKQRDYIVRTVKERKRTGKMQTIFFHPSGTIIDQPEVKEIMRRYGNSQPVDAPSPGGLVVSTPGYSGPDEPSQESSNSNNATPGASDGTTSTRAGPPSLSPGSTASPPVQFAIPTNYGSFEFDFAEGIDINLSTMTPEELDDLYLLMEYTNHSPEVKPSIFPPMIEPSFAASQTTINNDLHFFSADAQNGLFGVRFPMELDHPTGTESANTHEAFAENHILSESSLSESPKALPPPPPPSQPPISFEQGYISMGNYTGYNQSIPFHAVNEQQSNYDPNLYVPPPPPPPMPVPLPASTSVPVPMPDYNTVSGEASSFFASDPMLEHQSQVPTPMPNPSTFAAPGLPQRQSARMEPIRAESISESPPLDPTMIQTERPKGFMARASSALRRFSYKEPMNSADSMFMGAQGAPAYDSAMARGPEAPMMPSAPMSSPPSMVPGSMQTGAAIMQSPPMIPGATITPSPPAMQASSNAPAAPMMPVARTFSNQSSRAPQRKSKMLPSRSSITAGVSALFGAPIQNEGVSVRSLSGSMEEDIHMDMDDKSTDLSSSRSQSLNQEMEEDNFIPHLESRSATSPQMHDTHGLEKSAVKSPKEFPPPPKRISGISSPRPSSMSRSMHSLPPAPAPSRRLTTPASPPPLPPPGPSQYLSKRSSTMQKETLPSEDQEMDQVVEERGKGNAPREQASQDFSFSQLLSSAKSRMATGKSAEDVDSNASSGSQDSKKEQKSSATVPSSSGGSMAGIDSLMGSFSRSNSIASAAISAGGSSMKSFRQRLSRKKTAPPESSTSTQNTPAAASPVLRGPPPPLPPRAPGIPNTPSSRGRDVSSIMDNKSIPTGASITKSERDQVHAPSPSAARSRNSSTSSSDSSPATTQKRSPAPRVPPALPSRDRLASMQNKEDESKAELEKARSISKIQAEALLDNRLPIAATAQTPAFDFSHLQAPAKQEEEEDDILSQIPLNVLSLLDTEEAKSPKVELPQRKLRVESPDGHVLLEFGSEQMEKLYLHYLEEWIDDWVERADADMEKRARSLITGESLNDRDPYDVSTEDSWEEPLPYNTCASMRELKDGAMDIDDNSDAKMIEDRVWSWVFSMYSRMFDYMKDTADTDWTLMDVEKQAIIYHLPELKNRYGYNHFFTHYAVSYLASSSLWEQIGAQKDAIRLKHMAYKGFTTIGLRNHCIGFSCLEDDTNWKRWKDQSLERHQMVLQRATKYYRIVWKKYGNTTSIGLYSIANMVKALLKVDPLRATRTIPAVIALIRTFPRNWRGKPDILYSASKLGDAMCDVGMTAEATILMTEILRDSAAFDSKDPDVAKYGAELVMSIVNSYEIQEKWLQVLDFRQRLLIFYKEMYGWDHPHTLTMVNKISYAMEKRGWPMYILPTLRTELKMAERVYGKDDHRTDEVLMRYGRAAGRSLQAQLGFDMSLVYGGSQA